MPLVVFFHGSGDTADNFERVLAAGGWHQAAEQEGVILVVPATKSPFQSFPVWSGNPNNDLPEMRVELGEVMDLLQERDFFSIVEVRFTPDRSQALLGPGVGRRTAYIELATPLSQDTASLYPEVEEIFLRHGGQPHLGKKTTLSAHGLRQVYGERFERFTRVRQAADPEGKFLNAFTGRLFAEL